MIKWNDEHTYGWNKLIDKIQDYLGIQPENLAFFLIKFWIVIPLMCLVGILGILQTIDWGVHLYVDMVDKQLQEPPDVTSSGIIKDIGKGLLFMTALPFLAYSLPAHAISRIKKLIKKKKPTPPQQDPYFTDNEYLVQDWRGFVITQETHIDLYGFEGYPATHATDCECQHCRMASWNYAEENGYLRIRRGWPSRRQIFDYLNRQTYDYPWIKKEADFLPKKKMKVHKLDQGIRKHEILLGPGIYVREVDHSTVDIDDLMDGNLWTPRSNSEYYSGMVRIRRDR